MEPPQRDSLFRCLEEVPQKMRVVFILDDSANVYFLSQSYLVILLLKNVCGNIYVSFFFKNISCRLTPKSMVLEVRVELRLMQVLGRGNALQRVSPPGLTVWWEESSGTFSGRNTGLIRWRTKSRRNSARSR